MVDGFSNDSAIHRDLYTHKFLDSVQPLRKAGLSVEDICKCIGIKRRSFYRIIKGEKKADFNEMISAQTAAITLLTLQIKGWKP